MLLSWLIHVLLSVLTPNYKEFIIIVLLLFVKALLVKNTKLLHIHEPCHKKHPPAPPLPFE